jgi:hypothetical protein
MLNLTTKLLYNPEQGLNKLKRRDSIGANCFQLRAEGISILDAGIRMWDSSG